MSNEPGCSFQIRLPSVYTRPPCSIPQPRDICLAHRPPKWLRHGAADLLRVRRDDPRRKDVMSEPLTVRRELPAEQVLAKLDEPIRESPAPEPSLSDLISSVKAHGPEGLVAIRRDSRRGPGERSGAWRKIARNLRCAVRLAAEKTPPQTGRWTRFGPSAGSVTGRRTDCTGPNRYDYELRRAVGAGTPTHGTTGVDGVVGHGHRDAFVQVVKQLAGSKYHCIKQSAGPPIKRYWCPALRWLRS